MTDGESQSICFRGATWFRRWFLRRRCPQWAILSSHLPQGPTQDFFLQSLNACVVKLYAHNNRKKATLLILKADLKHRNLRTNMPKARSIVVRWHESVCACKGRKVETCLFCSPAMTPHLILVDNRIMKIRAQTRIKHQGRGSWPGICLWLSYHV